MKLATINNGTRDGALAVVTRDLMRAVLVAYIAPTLQAALDDWAVKAPLLEDVYKKLNDGSSVGFSFDPARAKAPLPRAYQWADFSSYVTHVELVRKARGADMPPSFWTDPLVYQGAADNNLGACDPLPLDDPAWGLDFEGEIAVITDDVATGTTIERAGTHIKLFMLVNDLTYRNLVPAELAKGFGFFQGKPQTAFSPVAVTPDELGPAWDGARVHLPLRIDRNGENFGRPNAAQDMVFSFPEMITHATKTRPLGAGAIIGSGTVSNVDRSVGSACIAEKRAEETIANGAPKTPYLSVGERVKIEMLDAAGNSLFGAIDSVVQLRGS